MLRPHSPKLMNVGTLEQEVRQDWGLLNELAIVPNGHGKLLSCRSHCMPPKLHWCRNNTRSHRIHPVDAHLQGVSQVPQLRQAHPFTTKALEVQNRANSGRYDLVHVTTTNCSSVSTLLWALMLLEELIQVLLLRFTQLELHGLGTTST